MRINTGPWLLALIALSTALARAEDPAGAKPAESRSATEVVKSLQDELIAVMKEGDKLTTRQRYERLKPVIEATHDLDTVARVVLSRAWADLTPEQQKVFAEKFQELGIGMYAANFAKYSGEEFKVLGEEAVKEKQVLVRCEFITGGGAEKHTFDYQVAKTAKGWRILNIIADGVSDLALKRSEYAAVISKEGFDALLKKLDQKIDETFNAPPKN